MEYKNPKIPEGINITDEHPLKDFFSMLLGIGLIVGIGITVLLFLAEQIVRLVPFDTERQLTESFSTLQFQVDRQNPQHHQKIEDYLQNLADQLAMAQDLPKGMNVTVHYMDVDEVNAFATLGGHIVIFRGLLEKMPNENALAMVVAHEIAHIKHRDPLVALGRGATIGLAMLSLFGVSDSGIAQQVVGNVSLLTHLSFSRSQEREADKVALLTLQKHYGHVKGADEIFKTLNQTNQYLPPPKIFSTHPLSENRIAAVAEFSKQHPVNSQQLRALPPWLFQSGRSKSEYSRSQR